MTVTYLLFTLFQQIEWFTTNVQQDADHTKIITELQIRE